MKNGKKILSLILSVIMVLGVCATGFTVSADHIYLYVGNVGIDLENSGSYYDGKVEYDAAKHTLTFNDFDLTYSGSCISAQFLDLTIMGSAKLTSNGQSVIYIEEGNLTLNGGFTVLGYAQNSLFVSEILTVEGGSLNVINTGNHNAVYVGDAMTVNGGSVYAKTESSSTNAISYGPNGIILNNGEEFALGNENANEVLIKVPGTLAGAGTADSPYMICDYTDLKAFSSKQNGGKYSAHAKLMKDIDASASASANDWTPIAYYDGRDNSKRYTGTFDGDGHKITGLVCNKPELIIAGLFSLVGEGGKVRNTGLEGGSITGKCFAGGVVGYNNGTVENCYSTGNVTATGETIRDDSSAYAGGVVGSNTGTVTNCYSTGNVTATATADNAYAEAYAGGVVGSNSNTLTNSYNTGNVTATAESTGDAEAYAGGVAGYNISTVTNCYSTGTVTATGETILDDSSAYAYAYAGGVVGGNTGTVTNCYSTGTVTATAESTGDVSQAYAGGVVGYNIRTLENCCYDRNTCVITGASESNNWKAIGYGSGTDVKGLTTAEMTGANALSNMVFEYRDGEVSPWLTKANNENSSYYPHLKGFAYDTDPTDANWPPKIETPVTTYPLWVGGNQVTSENMGALEELDGISVDEGGSVKFEPDADGTGGTLYLNNATITGTNEYYFGEVFTSNILVENTDFDLTINLEGENIINGSADKGIFLPSSTFDAALKIEGEGSIDVTAVEGAIFCEGYLTVDGTTLTATATLDDEGSLPDVIYSRETKIIGSTVTATASGSNGTGFYCQGSLDIDGSVVTATGVDSGIYVDNGGSLTVSGESVITANGGSDFCGILVTGDFIFNNGNDILTPEEYTIGAGRIGKIIYSKDGSVATTVVIGQPCSVTFNNYDGTELQSGKILKGTAPEYKGETPTRTDESGQYTYTFSGWKDGDKNEYAPGAAFPAAEGDITYTATFTQAPRKYEIKFVNEDGTELQSGDVAYGETPVYTGETPTKEQSDQYVYTFAGWSPEITSVTTDATYTATFTQAPRKYEIKFVNEDGTELQSSPVAWGETPKYTGETPTKTATAEYTYEFKGWSPEISQVSGEATYTATYTETPVDYKLTWKVDGESYKNETVPFGMEISKPDDPAKEGYTFAWVDEIPATMPAEDVTIKGEFTPIEYTATFVDENGETVAKIPYTVETEKLEAPAVPVKEGYNGEWEEYELTPGGVTVKPVYTPADICPLDNEYHGTSFWGRLVKFFHTVIWKAFNLVGINIYLKIW